MGNLLQGIDLLKVIAAGADLALLVSGSCLISAFFIFLIMYFIEKRIEIPSLKKVNLYRNLSLLLLLIGLYQIFTYLLLTVPGDPQKSLFYYRWSYLAGIPTIPIFLNVVLTLTIGSYQDIQEPTSKIKTFWKRATMLAWWPMWSLAAVVWVANLIDLFEGADKGVFLQARGTPLEMSSVPYIGKFSDAWELFSIFGKSFGLFGILWAFTLLLSISMIFSYIIRVIWFDKQEWEAFRKGKRLWAGLRDTNPTVKWIKTFSLLTLFSVIFLLLQGIEGYIWQNSFPIMAYTNFFVFFAIVFILLGEVFSAREKALRTYVTAFSSNIISRAHITLSHETGTPIMLIRGFFDRLSDEFKKCLEHETENFSKELCRKYLKEIDEKKVQINKLVELATNFKKVAGPFKTNIVVVSLKAVVNDVVSAMKLATKGKKITFNVAPDDKVDKVMIDPDQMYVILRNLIENAVDAAPAKDARIDIAWKVGEDVTLTIKDNGKGFSRKESKNVGKLYYTTKPDGTGLGLGIVKNFLKEIKGELKIDSEPGKGTTVTIKFLNSTQKELNYGRKG